MSKQMTFFNRELSWIEFNARVLGEATRKDIPLLERLKFLSIVSSNFDEFFMVRVASLKRQERLNPEYRDDSRITVREQLSRIYDRVHALVKIQHNCLNKEILPLLAKEGITYLSPLKYTTEQESYLKTYFENDILPLLTPLRTDNPQDFPHIGNLRMHVVFLLKNIVTDTSEHLVAPTEQPLAIVQIPTSASRIVWLPSADDRRQFTVIDDVIRTYGTLLFPGYTVEETMLFKITRDADFAVDEDREDDFVQAMEEVISNRQTARAVRMNCNSDSDAILDILTDGLGLTENDVYRVKGMIDPSALNDVASMEGFDHLRFPTWQHFWPQGFPPDIPLWDVLKNRDVLLHVPYESYEPVLNFVNTAAEDSSVLAIKMTLYRTSGNSPIIQALSRAARSGKQVTAFVELKARFDEKQNISWAEQLEKAGVIVVYGIANLKVHAKILLVVRREVEGIRRYVHLSTGNYNDKTARFYVDMSLFTSNPEIANDATVFFNMVSGYSAIQTMKRLYMAPLNLKSQLLTLIDREIQCSTPQTPGLIMAKMNSLSHVEIIRALYNANRAGVHIILNVRGICTLIPGVSGQSENITVLSVIDRFLEHTRVFYFQNGGEEEVYLSSADWMPRNLDRRVELMFPVQQKDLFTVIKEALAAYISDNTHAHYLQKNGKWIMRQQFDNEESVRSQETLYNRYKKIAEAQEEMPLEFTVRRR